MDELTLAEAGELLTEMTDTVMQNVIGPALEQIPNDAVKAAFLTRVARACNETRNQIIQANIRLEKNDGNR